MVGFWDILFSDYPRVNSHRCGKPMGFSLWTSSANNRFSLIFHIFFVPSGKFSHNWWENRHFSWENPLFLWPRSIVFLYVYQRICLLEDIHRHISIKARPHLLPSWRQHLGFRISPRYHGQRWNPSKNAYESINWYKLMQILSFFHVFFPTKNV